MRHFLSSQTVKDGGTAAVEINGGTFKTGVYIESGESDYDDLIITGGTFTGSVEVAQGVPIAGLFLICYNQGQTIEISGGSFSGKDCGIFVEPFAYTDTATEVLQSFITVPEGYNYSGAISELVIGEGNEAVTCATTASPTTFTKKTYSVNFNSNGGSAVASQTVAYGDTVTKPTDPTLDGYTFKGWYTDEALTTAYDFSKEVTSAFTLYAKWVQVEGDIEKTTLTSDNTEKTTLTSDMVSLSSTEMIYTGKALKPTVTVKDGSTTLKSDTDYTVEYSNNKNVGTATVTVTGKGSYTGTVEKTFTIKVTDVSTPKLTVKKGRKLIVKSSKGSKNAKITGYQLRYKIVGSSKWKVKTYKTTGALKKTLTKLKKGKRYSVQVRAYVKISKKNYYGAWSKSVTRKKIK